MYLKRDRNLFKYYSTLQSGLCPQKCTPHLLLGNKPYKKIPPGCIKAVRCFFLPFLGEKTKNLSKTYINTVKTSDKNENIILVQLRYL